MRIVRIAGSLVLGLLLLLPTACATTGTGGGGSSNLITREQVAEFQGYNAYEVVQQLKPQWLRARGRATMSGGSEWPVVYINRMRAGSLDELRRLRSEEVERIRFLNAPDATMEFGTNHTGGAILVSLRQG